MAKTVARKAPAPPVRRPPPRPAPAPVKLAAPAPTPGTPAGGAPLAPQVAAPIAESLGVDVSPVRVHTGPTAASTAEALGARAFALGSHVVLGAGARPTDLGVMAHEVAHVVQQQGAPRVQLWTAAGGDGHEREAQRAAEAVTARRRFSVLGRTRQRVQRLGISDVLDWFADKANLIPGYRMLTIVIGVNPINMRPVERSPANILRAIVEFIPGGGLITQVLDRYGVFERAGVWVEGQLRTLGLTGAMFRDALMRFLDGLGLFDLLPWRLWDRAKRIFTEPVGRLLTFVRGLAGGILQLIKDAVLRPLAALAARTPAWDLLCAVLGRNPITGDPVPRTAETLIGGFMKLIGQEEIWRNIQRARAIPRAWAWFQRALAGLISFVSQIPRMFLDALRSLEIADIVVLPNALVKVGRAFAGFFGRFLSWAGQQVMSLLQIIFEVVAPGAMPYIRRAAGAFTQIIRNPIAFVRNLVRAGIQGFRQFGRNFLNHLRRSLIQWLTGTLAGAGVYIPQAFELREIIKFVLSVLGLTWANIRSKLVRLIPDPVVRALESGMDFVVTLVREGPAAAWDKIRESISNLREMVMEQIMSFVRNNIVTAAITRLVSSLNPAGAFIQAIIAIYNTVMFFVERLRQIAQVARSFIDSISAIAAGGIGTAANRVEQTMGGLLTLVISFLARLVGLGNVSTAVKGIVNRIRAPIDRALDRVVDWIVGTARRLGRLAVTGARRAAGSIGRLLGLRKAVRLANGEQHSLYFQSRGERARLMMASNPIAFEAFVNSIPGTPATSGDKRTAVTFIREIDRLEDDAIANNVDRTDTIRGLLEELAPIVVSLMERAARRAIRAEPPVYAGLTPQNLGRGMRVTIITNAIGGGSPPSYTNAVYAALGRRREGGRVYYIRGHLLNENLGGPGGNPQNLTPLSQIGNREHLHQVENIIKPTRGVVPRAFLYTVTPSYGRPLASALLNHFQDPANPDPQKATKAAVVRAEQHVPQFLVCLIKEIDPDTGRPKGEMETRITVGIEIGDGTPAAYVVQ